jgi:acyl-CoA hydrolase/RimJ/RimL family protein N-acetyltransferase
MLQPSDWNKYVKSGSRVFIGSGAACPNKLVEYFLENLTSLNDIEMVHILTLGESAWTTEKYQDKIRVNALFLDPKSRVQVCLGKADYTPCFLSEIPSLFKEGILPLDLAIIQVSPPDEYGYCSLGVSVDIVSAACQSARYVIAQVNRKMPRTYGQSFVHKNRIDAFWEYDQDLPELKPAILDETALKIGQYVSLLIDDNSTLQMGIGKIPDAVLKSLVHHKGLGIHTEMFSDGVLELIGNGVITNEYKSIHRGKTITSFCMGTQTLYDFVNQNPHVEFYPSEYVNRPTVIAQNKKMVAINSAIEVDLTGQVVADSVGHRFYSGIGGQVDFIRGAAMSEQGRPIIALPSTARNDTVSRIVPYVTQGSGVVTSRGDVHYIVTEYGIATLRGRSIRERALELIQVAHPKFRDELTDQVVKHFWVPPYQKKQPSQVKELGGVELKKIILKDKKDYILRPLHPADERRLQEFFYSHNQETLAQRYHYVPKSMSRERAHDLVNVDQQKNLALCIVEKEGPREIIHAIGRYYLSEDKASAEAAFVVSENKRGVGMATALVEKMILVATKRGLKEITAMVRADNRPMIHIFVTAGFRDVPIEDVEEKMMVLSLTKKN